MFGKCYNCPYFKKANWNTLKQKLFGVVGYCTDNVNPDFGYFAQRYGRGIGKSEAIFSPKWCRFKK